MSKKKYNSPFYEVEYFNIDSVMTASDPIHGGGDADWVEDSDTAIY